MLKNLAPTGVIAFFSVAVAWGNPQYQPLQPTTLLSTNPQAWVEEMPHPSCVLNHAKL
jgi:hypothetical protein